MKKVKLYPSRHGLIVRDPRTFKPLPESGEEKPRSGYWLRRLREGSVSEKPLAPAAASTAESPAPVLPETAEPVLSVAPVKNRKQTETDK